MIKECEICGKEFSTTNSRIKYCDECRPKQDRLKKYMSKELERSKKIYYQPQLFKFTCDFCGKETQNISKGIHTINTPNGIKNYCSNKCYYAALPDYLTCGYCGKPLKDIPGVDPMKSSTWYCCDICKEQHEHAIAKASGWLHICETCGKEFIRKREVARWCSDDCKKIGIKKDREESKKKPRTVERFETCLCCHKVNKRIYEVGQIPENFGYSFCDDNCKSIYESRLKRNAKRANNSSSFVSKPKKESSTHLCTTCKTSYKDCYLTKSNFRNDPKGAKRDAKGNVISCPLFK